MKKAWEVVKKHSYLFTFPAGAFSIMAVTMINDVNYRDKMEKYHPEFVEFIRKYHGFKDEVEEERQHTKLLEKFFATPINVEIKVDGLTKVVKDVHPNTLITDLLSANQVNQVTNQTLYCSNLVNFEDSDQIPVEPSAYLALPANYQPVKTPFHTENEFTFKQNSIWHSLTNPTALTTTSFSQYTQLNYRKFDNYVNYLLTGYVLYGENCDEPRIKQLVVSKPSKVKKFIKPIQENMQSKLLALQKISDLEYRIKELEAEKRYSLRDIDSLQQEINDLRQEITTLRRNYINFFYYF